MHITLFNPGNLCFEFKLSVSLTRKDNEVSSEMQIVNLPLSYILKTNQTNDHQPFLPQTFQHHSCWFNRIAYFSPLQNI
jgi:hypothetical protein